MKFGHDVLDREPQICICSGECEIVLPPACARAHPARSISAHLARSIRINCISARERARWMEGEGGRFSPSVGLVLLQGESFKILPPMWLLVFTLMTPPPSTTPPSFLLSLCFLARDFPGFQRAPFPAMHVPTCACTQINNACLLTIIHAISDKTPCSPSATRSVSPPCFLFVTRQQPPTCVSAARRSAINNPTRCYLCLPANYRASSTSTLGKWPLLSSLD